MDEMVRGRILELRWSPTVTDETRAIKEAEKKETRNNDLVGDKEGEDVGPVLLPTTPILGYAMRVVLKEWGYEP